VPSLCGVSELAEVPKLVDLALDPLQRRRFGEDRHVGEQDLVAGQAEEVGDAVALAPAHRLRPAVVTVAADQDVDLWPAPANGGHDMAQYQHHLGPVRGLAGAEDHRHRLARGRLVDVDRQEAALAVVGVEQRELLLAVRRIAGVVDVENDPTRHLLEAVAEQLDHRRHHPLECRRAGQVLQPAHGRLRAQVLAALGQPADRHLERRVDPQAVAVVGIRIAGRDQQHAEADHLGQGVPDALRCARVGEAARQPFSKPEPTFDLGQEQHLGIRGQPAAIEGEMDRLAADR
jgi:hypothetical protein